MDFGIFIVAGLTGLALLFSFPFLLYALWHRLPNCFRLLWINLALTLFLAFACQTIWRISVDEGLWGAARSGNYAEAQEYLRRGASPEATWEDGSTVLKQAQENHDTRMIQLLKAAGARR